MDRLIAKSAIGINDGSQRVERTLITDIATFRVKVRVLMREIPLYTILIHDNDLSLSGLGKTQTRRILSFPFSLRS